MRALGRIGAALVALLAFGCASAGAEDDSAPSVSAELRTGTCARTPDAPDCQLHGVSVSSFVGTHHPAAPLGDACVLFVRDVRTERLYGLVEQQDAECPETTAFREVVRGDTVTAVRGATISIGHLEYITPGDRREALRSLNPQASYYEVLDHIRDEPLPPCRFGATFDALRSGMALESERTMTASSRLSPGERNQLWDGWYYEQNTPVIESVKDLFGLADDGVLSKERRRHAASSRTYYVYSLVHDGSRIGFVMSDETTRVVSRIKDGATYDCSEF
jgi:hypothetical protein